MTNCAKFSQETRFLTDTVPTPQKEHLTAISTLPVPSPCQGEGTGERTIEAVRSYFSGVGTVSVRNRVFCENLEQFVLNLGKKPGFLALGYQDYTDAVN
jgi:hypothetical protein